MEWHARLRAEEDRVAHMEQTAFKLVAAASNVLCQQGGGNINALTYTHMNDQLARVNSYDGPLANFELNLAVASRPFVYYDNHDKLLLHYVLIKCSVFA